jgi:hypothetical protein
MRFRTAAKPSDRGAFEAGDDSLTVLNAHPGIFAKPVRSMAFPTHKVAGLGRNWQAMTPRNFDEMSGRRTEQTLVWIGCVLQNTNQALLALLGLGSALLTLLLTATTI